MYILKHFAFVSLLALVGCSSVTVTSNYDRSAAFGKYKTYSLAPSLTGQKLSPASEDVLSDAIRKQLAARGITEAKVGKGDLAIVRHVFTDDKVTVREYTDWGYGSGIGVGSGYGGGYNSDWPYAYGSYGIWTGGPESYMNVQSYTQGTLILDVVDTRTNKLVYRGTATAVVKGQRSNARKIQEAVAKMVDSLPTKR